MGRIAITRDAWEDSKFLSLPAREQIQVQPRICIFNKDMDQCRLTLRNTRKSAGVNHCLPPIPPNVNLRKNTPCFRSS